MVRMVCPPINPSAGPGACWSEAVDYSKHWSQSTQLRSSSPSNSTQSLDLRLSGKIQGGPHTRRRSLEDIPTFHARFVRKFCQDYSAWKDGTLCMLHCLESRSIKTGNFPEWIFSTLQPSRLFLHSRQRKPCLCEPHWFLGVCFQGHPFFLQVYGAVEESKCPSPEKCNVSDSWQGCAHL